MSTPAVLLHTPSVPAEFKGRARSFLARLEAAEPAYVATLAAIMLPLRKRYLRRAKQLAGDTAAAETMWREHMPVCGRIAIEAQSSRSSLSIRELRAFARMEGFDEWGGASEPALAILLVGVDLRRDRLEAKKVVLALVGLHALARRYQRGFDVSDQALFSEFRSIAAVANALTDARGEFRIRVGDGEWVGAVALVTDDDGKLSQCLSIRTFI